MRAALIVAGGLVLGACATRPLTPDQLKALETPSLCEQAGIWFARNDAQQFHRIHAELERREALTPHCISLAQIGLNAEGARTDRRRNVGDAFSKGMDSVADGYKQQAQYQIPPVPVSKSTNCQTTQTSNRTATTTCR